MENEFDDIELESLELDQMISDAKWKKEILSAIKNLASKEKREDSDLKPLLQKLFAKLSEPTPPQKELPTPQVNVTNNNKEVAEAISGFNDKIQKVEDKLDLLLGELQRKKNVKFTPMRNQIGDIISVNAEEK